MRRTLLAVGILLAAQVLAAEETVGPPAPAAPGTVGMEKQVAPARNPSASPGSSEADEDVIPKRSLYEQYWRGGFWMHPILLCSFVGVAFCLERIINMRRSRIVPPALALQLNGDVSRERVPELEALCRKYPSCLSRVLQAGLGRASLPLAEMERASGEQSQRELYDLRRNVRPLGIVATVAPMFGLLGTVSGMISAFDVVARHGAVGNPRLLSGSISEALLTTGFGLIVAIPALLMFHYFRGQAENLIVEVSEMSERVFARIEQSSTGGPSQPPS